MMTRITLSTYLLIISLISSCSSHDILHDASKVFHDKPPSDSLEFYYPPSLNTKSFRRATWDNFAQNWYSSSLYSLKEPILFKKSDTETMYRLLWLRSFDEPVCFSIKLFNNEWYLRTKMLDRQPAFYPTVDDNSILQEADRIAFIVFDQTIKLNESEWEKISHFLMKINFWTINSIVKPDSAMDGSDWVLEGYKEGKYHYIQRDNGMDGLREFAEYLIKLSDLKITKENIY